MVKVPSKRKQKQKQKQKVIQKTKVSQNVKVVIGEVKRKQVRRKASGSKAGASAKPPIVLNISNPQPLNNPLIEYYKKQLQNQTPIKGTTLAQNEILNEREENKASRAGALHRLDEEPGKDVERRMKAQGEKLKEDMKASKKDDENIMMEMRRSLKPVSERKISPNPLRPIQPHPKQNLMAELRQIVPVTPSSEETQSSVMQRLQTAREEYENLMTPNPYEALEDEETRMEFPSGMELAKRREMNRQDESEGAGAGAEPPKRKGRGPNKTAEQLQAEAEAKIKKAEEKKQKDEERKQKAEQRQAQKLQKEAQKKSKKDRRR